MKVAICSSGNSLDSTVDPRFGRCPCFAVVDPETMETTFVTNPGAGMGQGAGIQAAQAIAATGATSVIAGNMGPNAFAALSAAGIRMFTAVLGTVRTVLDQYLAGSLAEITGATVAAHSGMGAGPQAGPGQGFGPGRGMGRGRGTGRGRGACGRRGRAS